MVKLTSTLLLISLLCLGACSTSDSAETNDNGDKPYPTYEIDTILHQKYSSYFPIGAAVQSTEYGGTPFDTAYTDLLPQYNSLTAENCMKPNVIQPSKGSFEWVAADRIADYAAENNMRLRGHVLVWHSQTGQWMADGTKQEAYDNMQTHIKKVMARYKDTVTAWDVVNEAISDGSETTYRESSLWYQAYGDATFIQDAFDLAHAQNTGSKLFYNDYSVVNEEKRERIVQMINELNLIEDHHLDGIGMQAHWKLDWPSTEVLQETIDIFHEMGLEIHITELDIDLFDGSGNTTNREFDTELSDKLADRYEELFALFRENRDKITSVTFWGIADDHTWLDYFYNSTYNSDSPLKAYPFVFDEDHKAKEAYKRITSF